eukprot:CAMPEP_0202030020 /NCGR_PEP_ID=MMETSP0905-20130828/64278_1 /ASSEMBLY_ACC=CAM_ASM_000554 /TAXON_ID=420261 /ORGANISM="Thalassiosira antarctica, Strain CCMP982" /LENGTH=959 /DNA_ID=CAMNT_0048593805 /DNA_START=201 /DNA_END=3080 /DNA_ORIENTATION=-
MGFETATTEQFIASAAKGERVGSTTTTTPLGTRSTNAKADERRQPADDDSESEGGYSNFLAFLKAPSEKALVVPQEKKKKVDFVKEVMPEVVAVKAVVPKEETVVKAVPVQDVPVAVARQEKPVAEESVSSEDEAKESGWSSSEDEETDADSEVAAFPTAAAAAPAPAMTKGMTSIDELSVEGVSAATTSTAAAAAPTVSTAASTQPKQVKFKTPSSANPKVSLMSDEASVTSNLSLHSSAPIAVEYFTKKAAIDLERNTIEMRRLSLANMSASHRYFDQRTQDDAIKHAAEVQELIEAPRPAAIEYFTLKEMEAKSKRQLAIEEASDVPAAMAVHFFTEKARIEKERKAAEIRAIKENPPPPSLAGQHFEKVNEARKIEIEEMMNEPAPMAIEYFTQKARDEKQRQELAMKASDEIPYESSVATQHFTNQQVKKAQEMDALRALRAQVKEKEQVEPLPVDYFTKLGDAETAAKAKSSRELAESQMPVGIAYFTAKGEEDKIAHEEEQRQLSEETMSVATRHFHNRAEAASLASLGSEQTEVMPAAIQHFTMADRVLKEKKRKEIREMNDSPPEMSSGQAYFTNKMRAELERRDAETAAKAKAGWELAQSEMPIGIAYFTAKGEEDRIIREAELRQLSEQEMSVATQHFTKLAAEKKANAREEETENMPAAIQHFTVADRAEKDKKRAEIEEVKENPPDMSPGQAYFTNKMRAELERQAAEIQAMKDNPPPASVAGQHFEKVGEQRAKEIEAMMNEPAPHAIEYFTQKAKDEKKKQELALKTANESPVVASLATLHFEEQERKKAAEIEVARSQTLTKEPMEPLPFDYFSKQGEKETEAKAAAAWEVAEAQMPIGIAYFTAKAEQDKAIALAEFAEGNNDTMSVATQHFHAKAAEEEAERIRAEEEEGPEIMHVAIQKFTMEAREETRKRREALEELKNSPVERSVGVAHFTPEVPMTC